MTDASRAPGTALFISPHLDDVVFSCGGLAALLADAGWRTVLSTMFTRSVVPATGFALACQLDKGLPPDVDYMKLRREEDRVAAAILGFSSVQWLDLPEAPHRGYDTPPALFGAVHETDAVAGEVERVLQNLREAWMPDLVLAPQALGNHVDHQIVTAAVQRVFDAGHTAFYRDTPYAVRQPDARPMACIPGGPGHSVGIQAALPRKTEAAASYVSQLGFQFGGAAGCAEALSTFAFAEGDGVAAERFLGAVLPL